MQKEVLLEIVKQNHANHFSFDRVNQEMHPFGKMKKGHFCSLLSPIPRPS